MSLGSIYCGNPVNKTSPLNRGLVSWWLTVPWYKSGPRFIDLCGYSHGTLTNNPTWASSKSRQGGFGSLIFDGTDDFVDCGNPQKITSITEAITVACWVCPTVTTRSDLVGQWSSSPSNQHFLILQGVVSSQYGFYTSTGSGGPGTNGYTFTVDKWDFVVGTYDRTNISLYVNGRLISQNPQTFAMLGTSTQNVLIGKSNDAIGSSQLDDIRIWNRALSAHEVAAIYRDSLRNYPNTLNKLTGKTYSFTPSMPIGAYARSTDKLSSVYYGDPINRTNRLNHGLVNWYLAAPWYASGPRFIDLCRKSIGTRNSGVSLAGPALCNRQTLKFNGSSGEITISNSPSSTSPFTVSVWVYPATDSTAFEYRCIFGGGNNMLMSYGGEFIWYDLANYLTGYSLPTKVWKHLVVTADGSNLRFYVGHLDGTISLISTQANTTATIPATPKIGNNASNQYWNGNIDDLTVFTRAMSLSEIVQRHQDDIQDHKLTLRHISRLTGALDPNNLQQYAFRVRNDDGSETTAAWKTEQDVAAGVGKSTNFRLRVQTNSQNAAINDQLKLQWRKVGDPDTEWRDI